MHLTPARVRWTFLGAAALIGFGGIIVWRPWTTLDSPPTDTFPVTPLSSSPFLNAGPDAQYVGSDECRKCHEDRHSTFRRTGMGRSMADVDLANEPPDAAFDHALSKRRYEVRRRDGQMWHRELLLTSGPEIILAEYPMKYVVGSGRHSRTYLVDAEGFLVESPVTWYTAKKAWGMSPGYDHPEQRGFERAAGEGCLHCHAGRAEAIGNSLHKMRVTEPAIGCERCHGPGSLHVARHAGKTGPSGHAAAADLTIVNPARLSRDLAEAVCQQCHLRCSAMVPARGRKLTDFRPSLPLSDIVHAYMLETLDRKMTVVGHVEQMHLSRCYQSSTSLTCLTCHSPHSEPADEAKTAHYQAACQQCHRPERCKMDPDQRMRESPANDCVHCHMPRSPTEIPHLAFTHHRIGIHGNNAIPDAARPDGDLKPFLDLARFSDVDRKRSLGLAYLEVANRDNNSASRLRFRDRAFDFLSAAHSTGLRDAGLAASLARIRFDMALDGIATHAEEAIKQPDLSGQDRCNALYLLAEELLRRGSHARAAIAIREVTQLRRHSADWVLLAECERALGHDASADAALVAAARINPRLWKIHQYLADRYARQGDATRAAWHQQRAVP